MTAIQKIKKELSGLTNDKALLVNECMASHTSFRAGGKADLFLIPGNISELIHSIHNCKAHDYPFFVMGNGSNLLVKDGGFRGAIISTENVKQTHVDLAHGEITAECGLSLSELANIALKHSLAGLAFASGIPGSVGGAVYMNAGAYDGEMKQVVKAADILDLNNMRRSTLSNSALDFSYRASIIQKRDYLVISATFALQNGDYEEIKANMLDLNKRRKGKQPLEYPSAGSTFKRPDGFFAGKLIESAGLKGRRIGGAMVSEKHSGFIINYENATAKHIIDLIHVCVETVYEKHAVTLVPEVRIIGED